MRCNYSTIFFIFLFILVMSCFHYSFTGTPTPGINSIAIPIFEDRSSEYRLKEKLNESLVNKFLKDNSLKITSIDKADGIINGVITRVLDKPSSLEKTERARQFELHIYLDVTFKNKKTGKIIFQKSFDGFGIYSDLSERDKSIDEAVEKLATDVLNNVISGW
ncbi:hypothetical protein DRQ09_06105 [candidate division KSB1 bacterium]|nr:MAG: hypothetical protein DRQ09_06105 [candidate division KSB1 bacterium]